MFASKRPRLSQSQNSQRDSNTDTESEVSNSQPAANLTTLKSLRAERSEKIRSLTQRSQRVLQDNADPSMSQVLSQTRFSQQLGASQGTSYFDSVLAKNGLREEEGCVIIDSDISIFRMKLEEALKESSNYPNNLPGFLATLQDRLSDPEKFELILSSVAIKYPDEAFPLPYKNQSLVKILLTVECLQKKIVEMLLERLRSLSQKEDQESFLRFDLVFVQFNDFLHYEKDGYLHQELFKILPTATISIRDVLIAGLDNLVPTSKQSEALEAVMDLVESDEELFTKEKLEVFERLKTSPVVLERLRARLVKYMKNAPKSLIPVLVRFLLQSISFASEDGQAILREIRLLDWAMDSSVITEIFDDISRSINCSKPLAEAWIRVICACSSSTHCPADLAILLAIASSSEEFGISMEALFKRRIRAELFSIPLLQRTFKLLGYVVVNYVSTCIDLFESLFRDRKFEVSNFGCEGFKQLFQVREKTFDKDLILTRIINLACMKAVEVPFIDHNLRTNALMLLCDVKKKFKGEMRSAFYHVEKILDYGKDLSSFQFRLTIDILCCLAYEHPGDEILQDHIDLLVRKMVTSSILLEHQKQALISIGRILSYTMWHEDLQTLSQITTDSEVSTYQTVSQIPAGAGQNTGRLISLALKVTANNSQLLTLFYDECAATLLDKARPLSLNPDKDLLRWLSDQIHLSFQDRFVVDKCPDPHKDLEFDYFYGINLPEENENDETNVLGIAINITPACLKNENFSVLFSHLHLLTALSYRRYNGSLDMINAILGCALVLPKQFSQPESLLRVSPKLAFDTLTFTINWFREVITCFSMCEQEQTTKRKILQRLSQLIELETTMKVLLAKESPRNYEPPVCACDLSPVQKKPQRKIPSEPKKPKKTSKKASPVATQAVPTQVEANTTTGNLPLVTQAPPLTTQGAMRRTWGPRFSSSYGPLECYRQLGTSTVSLLKEPFEIRYPVAEEEAGQKLFLEEFRFLLDDLISKLESIPGTRKFKAGRRPQHIPDASNFVIQVVEHLPHILAKFASLTAYIKDRQSEASQEENSSDEVKFVKISIGVVLHLLAALFSWTGFKQEDHQELLEQGLKLILEYVASEPTDSDDSLGLLALNAAISLEEVVMDLRTGVHLFHFVKVLAELSGDNLEPQKLARKLLTREWVTFEGNIESSSNSNILLNELMKGYTKTMKMSVLREDLKTFAKELDELKSKRDFLQTFKNINMANQNIVYRGLAEALVRAVEENNNDMKPTNEVLEDWKEAFNVMVELLEVAESVNSHRNWMVFLVHSHKVLKIFVRCGPKVIQRGLKSSPDETTSLLKIVQKSTRFMNKICNQSKLNKNTQIMNQIPEYRKTIEALIYQIKSAYTANNMMDPEIWTVGQLKPKDMFGEEIMSQVVAEAEEDVQDDSDSEGLGYDGESDESESASEASSGRQLTGKTSRTSDVF